MKLYDFDFIECYDEEANYDFDENQKKQIKDLGDTSFSPSLASSDVLFTKFTTAFKHASFSHALIMMSIITCITDDHQATVFFA